MSREYECEYCGHVGDGDDHTVGYGCLTFLKDSISHLRTMVEKQHYAIEKLKDLTVGPGLRL
jgi:hypothetical protein